MTLTLEQARAAYWAELKSLKPVECPCCDRTGRIYKRKLNSGMAVVLFRFYREAVKGDRSRYIPIEEVFRGKAQDHRDWPLLKLWGLLEPFDTRTETENARGAWKITLDGRKFLRKTITAPMYVFVYNNSVVDFSEERTTIVDALGDDFDYAKLMSGEGG